MTRFARFTNQGAPLGDVQGVISAKRTRDVDGTDQLELTCVGELHKDERIVMQDRRGYWHEWIVSSPQQSHEQGGVLTTAVCDASYNELSLHPLLEVQNTDYTASNALTKALDGTRWAVGTVGVSGTATTSAYHESSLDLIYRICEVYGCEFYPTITVSGTGVTGRAINLVTARGDATVAHRFEYRHDLVNVTRTASAENVVTRLYGYGKGVESIDSEGNETGGFGRKISFADINGGKAYVEDATLLATFGIPDGNGNLQPPTGYADFPDCEDKAELLALTQEELDRRKVPVVTYEADVASLAAAGTGWGGADIGDVVDIVDTAYPTPLRLEGRVLEIVEDLLGDWSTAEITLGNIVETATGASARMAAALSLLQSNAGAWTAAASLGSNYSADLIQAINAEANATGGYTYITEGQGIRCYDVAVTDPLVGAEASAVCEVKGGTMRIANTKDAGGNWEWKTVFTSGRILAELIDAIGASSGMHAQLTPTGLVVYDGPDVVASFGTTATIGKDGQLQLDMSPGVMSLLNDTNDEIFSITENASSTTTRSVDLVTFADSSEVDTTVRTVSDSLVVSGAAHAYVELDGANYTLSSTYAVVTVTVGAQVSVQLTQDGVTEVISLMTQEDGEVPATLGVEYTVSHYDSAKLNMSGSMTIDGSGPIVSITNTNWSSNRLQTAYKAAASSGAVWFGIGNGGVNRGIYDLTADRWMIYTDSSRRTMINGDNFSVSSDGKVIAKSAHALLRLDNTKLSTRIGATAPSTNTAMCSLFANDKNGDNVFYSQSVYTTNRDLYRSFVCRRYSSNGNTDYLNGFYLHVDNSGNPLVTFTSGGAAAWKSALNITPSDVGITKGTVGQTETVSANSYRDYSVSFGRTYSSAPVVQLTIYSTSTSADFNCDIVLRSVTTTGFTARIFNRENAARSPGFHWTAIG